MNEAVDLFGNKTIFIRPSKKRKEKTLFNDYDGFVDKFEAKKTTDDCFTPIDVYNCVLNYVGKNFDISNLNVVRPFYPGGDYENCDYSENCIVVDNPPFSIISKIARFYIENDIKFFLFAPHLTLFSAIGNYTRLVVGANVIYENGANVKTSFVSNLFGSTAVMSDHELYNELENINESKKVRLPKYKYPPNVLTVSGMQYCVERGVSLSFDKDSISHISFLDSQKKHKKCLFGSGFLISEKAAAEKAAAEKAAAEKDNYIEWELSDREIKIIKELK